MLEIKNLSKSFHENKVLDHINLKIEKGDVVGIISPSGTVKSTLLRCINLKMHQPVGDPGGGGGSFWWKNGRSFQKTQRQPGIP